MTSNMSESFSASLRPIQRELIDALYDARFTLRSFRFRPTPPSLELALTFKGRPLALILHPRLRKEFPYQTERFVLRCANGEQDPELVRSLLESVIARVREWEIRRGGAFDPADFYAPGGSMTGTPRSIPANEEETVQAGHFGHSPRKLYHLQIGITYACQCRCAHCALSEQSRQGEQLTVEEIVELCRQAKEEMGAQVVELFGGEPLVHRELERIVEGCARHLDVWISSNALGFTRERAFALKAMGLKRCFFSLDSCHPEKHDRNRNYPGCFEAVMRALDYCEEAGIEANFSTCAMADMVISDELEELIAFTKQSKARLLRLVLPKMMGKLHLDESILLNIEEIEKIRRITAREEIAYVEAEGNYSGRIEKCFCLRGHVYVNPYGVVQPCVYTTMDFGNVRQHSLPFLYERMFHHEIFKDKSILNLCLLQNPAFVRQYLAEVSKEKPIVAVPLPADALTHRQPEATELMNDAERVLAHAQATHEGPFRQFVAAFAAAFPDETVGGSVLDLGCGLGEVTLPFAQTYPECRLDAIDGADNMIRQAEARRPAELASRVRFFRRYLPQDPLPQSTYDILLSNSLLHHLPDPQILWETVKRAGAPNARVFIMDLCRPATRQEVYRLLGIYAEGLHPLIAEDFHHSLLAAFTVDEVAAQLAAAGLHSLRVEPYLDLHWLVCGRLPA